MKRAALCGKLARWESAPSCSRVTITEAVARTVAQELGLDEYHAELSPADKIALVKKSRAQDIFTAMVGDGINDAPALAAADIGIAIGSGTDAAKETGEIILTRDDLYDIVRALVLGRLTLRKVKQNLFWAFFYNLAGIPVAAGLLYPFFGITLNPALAGLAMALSSVSVVSNALLLSRARETLAQIGANQPENSDQPPMVQAPAPVSSEQQENNHHHHQIENGKVEISEVGIVDAKLKCEKCGAEIPTPRHCDRAMHVETVEGEQKLVCWMGPGCGVADLPQHCGEHMSEVRHRDFAIAVATEANASSLLATAITGTDGFRDSCIDRRPAALPPPR